MSRSGRWFDDAARSHASPARRSRPTNRDDGVLVPLLNEEPDEGGQHGGEGGEDERSAPGLAHFEKRLRDVVVNVARFVEFHQCKRYDKPDYRPLRAPDNPEHPGAIYRRNRASQPAFVPRPRDYGAAGSPLTRLIRVSDARLRAWRADFTIASQIYDDVSSQASRLAHDGHCRPVDPVLYLFC